MTSLRQRLLIGLLASTLISTSVSALIVYERVRGAAADLSDYHLAQVAANLPLRIDAQPEPPDDGDPDNDILIQIWNSDSRLVYPSKPAVTLQKPSKLGYGQQNLRRNWRTYSESQVDRTVLVAQPISTRETLAVSLAVGAVMPFLVLIPVLMLLTWGIVGRTLNPLRRVAVDVAKRSADALQPVSAVNLPDEVQPLIAAVNQLMVQLDSALKAQREFIADAAHELRTPLAALKLQLQLADRAAPGEVRSVAFAKTYERLDRATHLVGQLLALARQAPGVAERRQQSVRLDNLIRIVASDFQAVAADRFITFGLKGGGDDLRIIGDPEALRVMLNNVVDNALRYTGSGGSVLVESGLDGRGPFIRVTDTGPGIPIDERDLVFNRFHRGEETKSSGSGLGLAIVKSVAERHGCKVELCDAITGSGLVFTIWFPLVHSAVSEPR